MRIDHGKKMLDVEVDFPSAKKRNTGNMRMSLDTANEVKVVPDSDFNSRHAANKTTGTLWVNKLQSSRNDGQNMMGK